MASGFSFAVLGPVRAWKDGSEVGLGSRQQQAVLAVLLLRAGTHVTVEYLVDALWSADPPPSAVGTIRTYISRLRKLPGGADLIRSAGSAYILITPPDSLDATRFRQCVERSRQARADGDVGLAAACLREGLALWQGPPLAGVPGRFADTQRTLLEEQWLTATEDSADIDLALGRHAEVIPALTALTSEHPYRERLRALLMLALYRAGRQADALAVFDTTRQQLSTDLGIEPGAQLRELQLRILAADPGLTHVPAAPAPREPASQAAGAPHGQSPGGGHPHPGLPAGVFHVRPAQLPRDLPSFAGRRADLGLVLDGLADDPAAVGVMVIVGMAGVGKTTLAVHTAHLLAGQFPDGQLYVDLHGFDRSGMALSPRDALRQLLAGLGVPPDRIPAEAEAQTGLYRSLLAGLKILIVLDNARDSEQVRALLPGAGDSVILVTSRDQMRPLIAIEGARVVGLSPLSREDAREILVRRLGAARVDAEEDAVSQIVALCAGLPLTLCVMAAYAATHPTHSLSSMAALLNRPGSSLNALGQPDAAVDARASLSFSYQALSPGAARMLRLSALHPGGEASLDALASLAGVSANGARACLSELERVHLIAQPEPWQYACHDLVRAYAAELAADEDAAGRDEATMRMFDHYRQSAYQAMLALAPGRSPVDVPKPLPHVTVAEFSGPDYAFGWFSKTYPVLRVVLNQSVEHDLPACTWHLAWALDPFHDRQARWEDKQVVHRAALAAAERLGKPAWQAHSHRSLGQALRLLGEQRQAMEHFEVAQRRYAELGDLSEQARNLHNLTAVYQALDAPQQALTLGLRALELSQQIQDRWLQAVALNNLAWMYSNNGDNAAAIDCGQQALALLEEGEVSITAHVLRTLGQCRFRDGDLQSAAVQLAEALDKFRDQRDQYEEAYTLRWIAIVLRKAGNVSSARRAWQSALPILSDLGDEVPAFESFVSEDASTRR
jgi:DNA-binding SARP family transcriptional activator/tetratricopeptide (TPR) repeat protein